MKSVGAIVVLNGPSSAGKTTLALALRARLGPMSAALSLDQFFPFMHPRAPNDWPMFSTLTEALFATAVALTGGGFHVIVDIVFERPEALLTAQRALAGRVHRMIAVTCPVEILEAREKLRGNRRSGLARGQHGRVLQGANYDLHLDTSVLSPQECVDRIIELMQQPRTRREYS